MVSIALCTYNGARFLSQQLDSLLAQTYGNLEIVVNDDGSSDETIAILERYACRDARIGLEVNPENIGFGSNFRLALERCHGTFIAPCDQDDVWMPEKIAALVAAIGTRQLAYCDSILIDAAGKPLGPRMSDIVPMSSCTDPSMFAFGNCVSGHAMLFRRELLRQALPVPGVFFYDWWIAAVAAAAGGIVFCNQSLVLYRQHGMNVTDDRLSEMMRDAGIASSRKPTDDPSVSSQEKGHRFFRETTERLASLSRLPGLHQSFVSELLRLWTARENQYVSPALGLFMMRNRKRLLALTQMSQDKQTRFCRRMFRGLKK